MSSEAIAAFKLSRSPTPLATYMYLYEKAQRQCYIDYMEGAELLAAYLRPINIPMTHYAIPRMLRSYELNELAKILIRYSSNTLPVTYQQAEDAIYEYLIH